MRCRPARPDELPELARLVQHSFPGPGRTFAYWHAQLADGPYGGWEALWVGELDGRPVAVCQLLPLRQWVGGALLPMAGVGTVTVAPTHRRRGLAYRLLAEGLTYARERGDVLSALYPFSVRYYAKLGYAPAGEAWQALVPLSALPDASEAPIELVVDEAHRQAVQAVYEAAAPRANGWLDRTPSVWAHWWAQEEGGATLLVRDDAGHPAGYLRLRYRADLPLPERRLEVEERVALDPAADAALLAAVARLSDQWPAVLLRAHPDERLLDRLAEPRWPPGALPGFGLWFPAAVVLRGPMSRVLHVPAALEARAAPPELRLRLRLEVVDPVLPTNAGPWEVEIADGQLAVGPARGGRAAATLRLPVGTLARLLTGDLPLPDAVRLGLAALDPPEAARRLAPLFPGPRPWLWDRF